MRRGVTSATSPVVPGDPRFRLSKDWTATTKRSTSTSAWIVRFRDARGLAIRVLKERIIFPLMYGINMGSSCAVNLMVTKRGVITGYHLGCLGSGFDVVKITLIARVGYL